MFASLVDSAVAAFRLPPLRSLGGEVLLVDLETFKPPEELRMDMSEIWEATMTSNEYLEMFLKITPEALDCPGGHEQSQQVALMSYGDDGSLSAGSMNSVQSNFGSNYKSNATELGDGADSSSNNSNCMGGDLKIINRAADSDRAMGFTTTREEWPPAPENYLPKGLSISNYDASRVHPLIKDVMIFQFKVAKKSGLSETNTFLPKSIHPKYVGGQPRTDLNTAAEECQMVVCGAIERLLVKTGLKAQDIDILVTTCSIYCPTPSMSSMVVNHFQMRKDIQSYSLGGMGCAAGVLAINLVRDLLKAHPNSNALLVCNETLTPSYYKGIDKHRLVTNVLFRMGASAVLLSNKGSWLETSRAKYRLSRGLRVHIGGRDEAYRAIHYGPDDMGINGIYLGKNVVAEASRGLTLAMLKIGPCLLTPRQLLQGALYYTWQYIRMLAGKSKIQFRPSLARGVQHFLIHAGGAKVLDGIGSNLGLQESHLEPSRAVLCDYGNVSSSTTWHVCMGKDPKFRYSMTFIESVRGVKRGDRALQIGVGSGIKCGVNVWTAVRDIDDVHQSWDHRVTEERRCQVLGDRGSSGDQLLRSGPTIVWVAVWMLLLPWATGILLVLAQRLNA